MEILETDVDYVCPEYNTPIDDPMWIIKHKGRVYEVNYYPPNDWRFWIYPKEVQTLESLENHLDANGDAKRIDGGLSPICLVLKALCRLTLDNTPNPKTK